jgi:hypothetical protein
MSRRPPNDDLYELAGDVAPAPRMPYLGAGYSHFQQPFQQPFQPSFQQPFQQSYTQQPSPAFQQLQSPYGNPIGNPYVQQEGLYSTYPGYSQTPAISFANSLTNSFTNSLAAPAGAYGMNLNAPLPIQRDYIDLRDGIQVDCGDGVHLEKSHGAVRKVKRSKAAVNAEIEAREKLREATPHELEAMVSSNLREFRFESQPESVKGSLNSLKSLNKKAAKVTNKITSDDIPDGISSGISDLKMDLQRLSSFKAPKSCGVAASKVSKAQAIDRIRVGSF